MTKTKGRAKEKDYVPAPMVNWFSPRMLLRTGVQSVISSTFGNYADKREMEAALVSRETELSDMQKLLEDYRENKTEIWVDFLSDTGDGFNATYSMAKLLAKDTLPVAGFGETERGRILVLGGDQIYPAPTMEAYEQKFKIPFRLALPKDSIEDDKERPSMFAIPGNHDWYDGLGNFIKIFCQERHIGGWKTKQRRSYFAIPLPGNYWIWATDVQLNADIDEPQQQYFIDIAKKFMKTDDRVILITAEPAWVYREKYVDDKSFDRLMYFIRNFITMEDPECRQEKKFILTAVLTGDLHHYARYENTDENGVAYGNSIAPQLIGAGGGGAFMHLTNTIPDKLFLSTRNDDGEGQQPYATLKKAYPEKSESRSMNRRNILFAFRNIEFGTMMAITYVLFFWFMIPAVPLEQSWLFKKTNLGIFSIIGERLLFALKTPGLVLLSTIFVWGIYAFADKRSGRRRTIVAGAAHAGLQFVLMVLGIVSMVVLLKHSGLMDCNIDEAASRAQQIFLCKVLPIACTMLLSAALGWIGGCTIFGIYLWLTNSTTMNMHMDEASSSLSEDGYKNFLRLHVEVDKVTIYPIGVKEVVKNWDVKGDADRISVADKMPDYALIESQPIIIPAG